MWPGSLCRLAKKMKDVSNTYLCYYEKAPHEISYAGFTFLYIIKDKPFNIPHTFRHGLMVLVCFDVMML